MKPYNAPLPDRRIGRTGAADEEWMKWPPHSSDLTPCDFFLWDYVKEQIFMSPLSLDNDKLGFIITAAVKKIDEDMLGTWDELDSRLDICRVPNGAHIEHL
jgi:hypothetical protein